MMQTLINILVFIGVFVLITFQVVVLPRLQVAASMRQPDGSIPWLLSKSELKKAQAGRALQLALAFSVFSMLWFALHVSARFALGFHWISNPVLPTVHAESPARQFVESWFGISLMALLVELALGGYVMIKAGLRDYNPLAVLVSVPWALVACYTLWIISPLSIAAG